MKSKLFLICGLLGLFGCISAVATNLIGSAVVNSHNPISETISNLAITEYAWIQDSGLDLFALGLVACAVGLYAWQLGDIKWTIGNLMLGLLGVDVWLIAEHNKYAGREDVSGMAIHIYCVYVLGILFTLLTLLMAFGLRKVSRSWYRFSLGISIIWTILAPIFFFVPNTWDGAYERFIALIMVTWVAGMSWLLIQRGRRKVLIVRR